VYGGEGECMLGRVGRVSVCWGGWGGCVYAGEGEHTLERVSDYQRLNIA
jgi:hypothetical protein